MTTIISMSPPAASSITVTSPRRPLSPSSDDWALPDLNYDYNTNEDGSISRVPKRKQPSLPEIKLDVEHDGYGMENPPLSYTLSTSNIPASSTSAGMNTGANAGLQVPRRGSLSRSESAPSANDWDLIREREFKRTTSTPAQQFSSFSRPRSVLGLSMATAEGNLHNKENEHGSIAPTQTPYDKLGSARRQVAPLRASRQNPSVPITPSTSVPAPSYIRVSSTPNVQSLPLTRRTNVTQQPDLSLVDELGSPIYPSAGQPGDELRVALPPSPPYSYGHSRPRGSSLSSGFALGIPKVPKRSTCDGSAETSPEDQDSYYSRPSPTSAGEAVSIPSIPPLPNRSIHRPNRPATAGGSISISTSNSLSTSGSATTTTTATSAFGMTSSSNGATSTAATSLAGSSFQTPGVTSNATLARAGASSRARRVLLSEKKAISDALAMDSPVTDESDFPVGEIGGTSGENSPNGHGYYGVGYSVPNGASGGPRSYGHQRRDSATILPANHPSVIQMREREQQAQYERENKLSPTHSQEPNTGYARHRRSPTAPDPPTSSAVLGGSREKMGAGKTWGASIGEREEDEDRGSRERARAMEREREREYFREREQSQGRDAPRDSERERDRERGREPREERRDREREREEKREKVSQANGNGVVFSAAGFGPGTRQFLVNKKSYIRLDLLGRGGSSRVYRVLTPNNELYALKRVSLDKASDEEIVGYRNEITLLRRLEGNKRIIRLIDAEMKGVPPGMGLGNGADGEKGGGERGSAERGKGSLMMVMECGEIDLAHLLQEQQMHGADLVWIRCYWKQMLEAVQVIHEEKIVHSDLKPANFVLVKGALKLIDFGIANAISNDTTNIQRDHQIGTVNYMSPEAIELPEGMRRLKVGRSSDVWSLGCILYQMVYGQPPFAALSTLGKMKAIPDPSHIIDFPIETAPFMPASATEQHSPGNRPRDWTKKAPVPQVVIDTLKDCLVRNPKERRTIPELLASPWLDDNAVVLQPHQGAIDAHLMRQALQYAVKYGKSDPEWLNMQSERLVAELIRLSRSSPT